MMQAVMLPQSPRSLGLDKPEWRKFQPDTILKVLTSEKKYVLISAPPGSGKSAIALGLAAIIRRDYNGKTAILTSTKDLQDQYMQDAEGMGAVKVIGRSNFRCKIEPAVSAAQGICVLGGECEYAGVHGVAEAGCGYYDQLRQAVAADIVVANTAFYLADLRYAQRFGGDVLNKGLLVVDEAHDLAAQIRAAETVELKKAMFDRAKFPWPDCGNDMPAWVEWARGFEPGPPDVEAGILQARKELEALAERITQPVQMVAKQLSHEHVIIEPVWVNKLSRPILDSAPKVVFMTATPGNPELFFRELGIDPNDAEVIELPSLFNPARRPLHYWPVSQVSGNNPNSWDPLVPAIAEILRRNPDQKGLICCVSYKLGAFLAKQLQAEFGARIMFPDSSTRRQALKEFRESDEPLVMISPSMGVGVDLPFDQCRFVVIPKLPFPDYSDPVVKLRGMTKMGKQLGMSETASKLVQYYGRAMRDEDDWGVTWLLDSNFDWFQKAARKSFAPWFLSAVRVKRGEAA